MWTATRELKPRAQWQAVDGRAWCHMSVHCTARLTPKDSGSISVLFTWPFAIRGPCWERVRILFWDLGLVPKTTKEELEIFDLTPLARGISSPRIVSCQWLLSSFYSLLYVNTNMNIFPVLFPLGLVPAGRKMLIFRDLGKPRKLDFKISLLPSYFFRRGNRFFSFQRLSAFQKSNFTAENTEYKQ